MTFEEFNNTNLENNTNICTPFAVGAILTYHADLNRSDTDKLIKELVGDIHTTKTGTKWYRYGPQLTKDIKDNARELGFKVKTWYFPNIPYVTHWISMKIIRHYLSKRNKVQPLLVHVPKGTWLKIMQKPVGANHSMVIFSLDGWNSDTDVCVDTTWGFDDVIDIKKTWCFIRVIDMEVIKNGGN